MVPLAGIEPALLAETDFESVASTNSATGAMSSPKACHARSRYGASSRQGQSLLRGVVAEVSALGPNSAFHLGRDLLVRACQWRDLQRCDAVALFAHDLKAAAIEGEGLADIGD
jgi:hypothetical protein